ncbi:hypothetical protein B0A55_03390 [Friedmanniomyces simplex]|uniref:DNA polymerase n=1 Tax=Friedmanniomyces simplex TaxID=329884 RepID=A0A4U0XUW5_9PEZI|nr:hypothetical protein B0A55_03390 [Friedmanniomyces simplex]
MMSVNGAEKKLQEKRAFYANLDGALADSDDEPDPGRTASINVLRNASKKKSSPPNKQGSNGLPRSASDTNLAKDPLRRFDDQAQVERPKTSSGRAPPQLIKSATSTGVPSKATAVSAPVTAIPKMPKSMKRKRDGTIELVPEAQQIFKGMHFYFFPNDDKNPARAMRMMKAIEFGATWDPQEAAPDFDSTAEFDAAVRQAKDLQYVPLDDEGEDASRPTSSEGPTTDDEEQREPGFTLLKKTSKRRAKYQTFQDKFQCMQKHTAGTSNGPNATTITILQQMADYYGQTGDEWRIRAYRKAIATLRNHPTKVSTREEALALPQIGERLACKIEEIATTNRLRRLDNAKAEPTDQILQTFMQVYGAGLAKASEWVAQGYKTLDELLEKASLSENQKIGITHYEDFNSRIPRAEVEQHGAVVRQALHKIDPAFEVIAGGSYRRGAATSGDIDCLITRPDTGSAHLRAVILEQLVPTLAATGFLVAALAASGKDDGSKWHGASCLLGRKSWRRIDLLLVPSDELGAALIYFTGNDIFNRSMRLLASTKEMRLNQRGLYKECLRGYGREKLSEGTLVEGKDEKRIFEVLGVPWRVPEHRIC